MVDDDATVREGRRAPFKQLPDAVMDDDTLSNEAKLTYWYLKRIAGYSDDRAKVSVGRLAEKLHCSRASKRSARGWIGELVTRGWLDVVHHARRTPDGKTQHLVSEYVVHATAVPPNQPDVEPLGVGAGEHPPRGSRAPRVGAGEPPCSRKVSTEEVSVLDEDSANAASCEASRRAVRATSPRSNEDRLEAKSQRPRFDPERDDPLGWVSDQVGGFGGCEETMAESMIDRYHPIAVVNTINRDRDEWSALTEREWREVPVF